MNPYLRFGRMFYPNPMNQPFLGQLAEKIRSEYSGLGSRLCVVMPNRRAGLFLKRHLVRESRQPVWAPSVFSIEDFIAEVSGLLVPDQLSQVFGLFEVHSRIDPVNAGSFDDFAGWSRGLLRDFEEIDQYLVNPASLFGFLSEAKAINLWNPDGQGLTDFEKQYLNFFNSLSSYYEGFRETLLKSGQAYHGLACRMVADNPAQYLEPGRWDKILFAGFNAITPSQLSIIRYLIAAGKSEIIWDADSYYIGNPAQEAGRFLRKYLNDKSLTKTPTFSDFFSQGQKEIYLAGIPRNVGQARLAGHFLKKLIDEHGPEVLSETAIVLADETLLLPLLNAIPAEAGAFNITMGYPLKQSPIYTLFDALLTMHLNATSGKDADLAWFYYRDVLSLMQQAYMPLLAGNTLTYETISRLKTGKGAYISTTDFLPAPLSGSVETEEITPLFQKILKPGDLTALLIRAAAVLKKSLSARADPSQASGIPDLEILYSLVLILNKLHKLVTETGSIQELRTIQGLFREACSAASVPFYGEPLKGVQVMGMLETRTLDFRYIILLSANEDTLPARKSYNSFIPFDIRQNFGLPTHHDQQAVFAYHFYRLLQRCDSAWLIYNSEADELGGGEKSRFLSQIQAELPGVNPGIRFHEVRPGLLARAGMAAPISIAKSPEVMDILDKMATTGFSPTSLNTWISCPLRFYFTFVLRLHEADEPSETIDHRTLGNVIHKVLQDFYTPFVGSMPLETDYEKMLASAGNAIALTLQKEFEGGDVTTGRNLLIVEVARVWIRRFLQLEAEAVKQPGASENYIRVLEHPLKSSITIEIPGKGPREIVLKGFADRIDQVNGRTRIIDYKTGRVEAAELRLKSVEALFEPSAKPSEKAFQLMMYLYLASRQPDMNAPFTEIDAGIISFKSLSNEFMPLNLTGTEQSAAIDAFESGISDILSAIYDTTLPFEQTNVKEHCQLCPYKTICHKTEEKRGW